MNNPAGAALRICYLEHVPFEKPVRIATWARRHGHTLAACELYRAQPLPAPADFDWLVVMGGPMSVHDEGLCPWLVDEKKLVEQSVKAHKRVLGVCLGAQLLADILGAKVYRNAHKEIGWFPVQLTGQATPTSLLAGFPPSFTAFQWHGETFDIPSGAVHLARSTACENQAFQFGDAALALQFHLEVNPSAVARLIRNCPGDMGSGPYEQTPAQMLACREESRAAERLLNGMLDRLAAMDW